MNVQEFQFRTIGGDIAGEAEALRQWDVLAEASRYGTFYHTAAWFRAMREIEPRARLLTCIHKNQLIGGCVILERKRLGFAEAQKPWATFYNGPIFSPALTPQDTHTALGALLHHLRSTYDAVRLVLPPDFPYDPEHEEPLWNTSRDNSYLIDVSDTEALWKRLNRRARQRVRKASRLGVHCEPLEDGRTFYRLYRATYERQGLPFRVREDSFAAFWGEIARSSKAAAFVAKTTDEKPAAALLVGTHPASPRPETGTGSGSADRRQRSYFVLAASDPQLRKTDAVTLLWWETFKWCSERSGEIDLVGRTTPGISRFKRSFSPAILPYHELTCSPRGWRRIRYETLRLVRRLAR